MPRPAAVREENALDMPRPRPFRSPGRLRDHQLGIAAVRPAANATDLLAANDDEGVINVLPHDLPTPTWRATIFTMERNVRHCGFRRASRAAPADTDRGTSTDVVSTFIDSGPASVKARRGSADAPLRPSVSRALAHPRARRMPTSSVRPEASTVPVLHPMVKCNSVLDSVYSGPGTTRGNGSGGVGKTTCRP